MAKYVDTLTINSFGFVEHLIKKTKKKHASTLLGKLSIRWWHMECRVLKVFFPTRIITLWTVYRGIVTTLARPDY